MATTTAAEVMPIVSRLISNGYPFLSTKSSQKLRKVEQILGQEEFYTTIHHRNQLESVLNYLKPVFNEAEEKLDCIRHRRLRRSLLSLTVNRRNWAKRLLLSALNSACLKTELKCLKSIENIINEAYRTFTLLNLPSLCDDKRIRITSANSRRTTATPPLKVIGRNEDCEKIINLLHESSKRPDGKSTTNWDDSCFSVIGIHGIAGSGKSTLAQFVYAREEKESYFDLLMWIHVPRPDFSVHDVFMEMMAAATGEPCPQLSNLSTLQEKVQAEVSAKRFFLVLDDIWYSAMDNINTSDARCTNLRQILSPLRAGKSGSKILATSRTADAFYVLGALRSRCIPISELDDDAFLELLMHHALGVEVIDEGDRSMFQMIGADIAKNLEKSPLAAARVGTQLRIRQNIDFWRRTRHRVSLARALDPSTVL